MPLELLATFTLPDDVSSAGGMLWRGKHVLAVGYWTLPLLQLYSFEVGDRELKLVNSLCLPSSLRDGITSKLTLSHIALLPLYFSHDLHVDDITHEQPKEEEQELDLMAALESMDKQAVAETVEVIGADAADAAGAAGAAGAADAADDIDDIDALIGLLGCVAASYTGEILIYHAVMRLNKAGSVRKWDLYLHQRIPLATHVKEMVLVDENRIEGSIDYCRALLVSGDTGNFVLSFAQAVTSQETNKGNEHTNFHLIYDNDDSNGHDDRESFFGTR